MKRKKSGIDTVRRKLQHKRTKGLGDHIETLTKITGIKAAVKWIAGEDCGCDERKERLNKIQFTRRHRNVQCMTQQDHTWWAKFRESEAAYLDSQEADMAEAIWNRIFNQGRRKVKFCRNCPARWQELIKDVNLVFETYEQDQDNGSNTSTN